MRIERPRCHVVTPIGACQVFGAALPCVRSFAPARERQRLPCGSHDRPAVEGLPEASPKDRMTLSGAVAGPILIAGRVPRNSRLAGKVALVPRDLAFGPRRGRR
jgi:hypothetical protein